MSLLERVGRVYVTCLSLIIAGVIDNLFVKTRFYSRFARPMDNYMIWRDGNRVFGDNKTWLGFFVMIAFCTLSQIGTGFVYSVAGISGKSDLYNFYPNVFWYNVLCGFLFGFMYVVCELPNSFLKRRLGIGSGVTQRSWKGAVFLVIDQIDSFIGVMTVVWVLGRLSFGGYLLYVAVGGVTHLLLNVTMKVLRLRK